MGTHHRDLHELSRYVSGMGRSRTVRADEFDSHDENASGAGQPERDR